MTGLFAAQTSPINFALSDLGQTAEGRVDLRSFGEDFFGWSEQDLSWHRGVARAKQYANCGGSAELIRLLGRELRTGPDNVLVTDSGSQGLLLAITYFARTGHKIAVPVPYFPSYLGVINALDFEHVFYSLEDPATGMATIKTTARAGPVAVIVNTPNNPLGSLLDADFLTELNALKSSGNVSIISDEAYQWLKPAGTVEPEADMRVFSLGKALGLPGLRLGAMVFASPQQENVCLNLKRYFALHSCPLAESLAEQLFTSQAISSRQAGWKEKIDYRIEQLRRTIPFLSDEVVGPFLLVKLRASGSTRLIGVPGSVFGLDDDRLRICCAAPGAQWSAFLSNAKEEVCHVW